MSKLPYISILLIVTFASCNSSSEEIKSESKENINVENDSVIAANDSELEITEESEIIEETILVGELQAKSVEDDFVVPFYNDLLHKIYPDRELSVIWNSDRLSYESSLAENIEGGGISLNYLKVLEYGSEHVGIIGFEVFDEMVYNNCFAVLDADQYLCSAKVVDIQGNAVLKVTSNKSGKIDTGPYDYAYYYFAKNDTRTTPLYVAKNKQEFKPDAGISKLIIDELNKPANDY